MGYEADIYCAKKYSYQIWTQYGKDKQRSLWVSYAQQNFAQVGKNRNEVKETWLLWPEFTCLCNSVRITSSLSNTAHVQCCFIITQKLLLEASKTNTSFARLSASSSYVSLDLQQDNMHFASTLLQCFYHAN